MKLKDSNTRECFSTGSVRDAQSGKGRFELVPNFVVWLVGRVYEDGAIKYAVRNWEKGQPLGQYIRSAENHIAKLKMGMRDEPHILQAIWNLFGYVFTATMITLGKRSAELNDMWDQFEDRPAMPLGEYERESLNTFFQGEYVVPPPVQSPPTLKIFDPGPFDPYGAKQADLQVFNPDPVDRAVLGRAHASIQQKKHQKRYYVAGPMRGIPEFNFPEFRRVTKLLRAQGHEVFSPAESDEKTGFDPTGMKGDSDELDATGFDLRAAFHRDTEYITTRATHLCMLKGWHASKGAQAECALAKAMGLTVEYAWELDLPVPEMTHASDS